MRLEISGQLAKTLSSTNPCQSMIEIVAPPIATPRAARGGNEAALDRSGDAGRRAAAVRIIGYRDLATLVVTIERHSILVAQ